MTTLPNGLAVVEANDYETAFLYEEIFVRQAYVQGNLELPSDALIIDVGANIGLFSLFSHFKWPGSRFVAFEPVQPLFDVLAFNVALHGLAAELFCAAVGAQDGEAEMTYFPKNSMLSSHYADEAETRSLMRRYIENQLDEGQQRPAPHLIDLLLRDRLSTISMKCVVRSLSSVLSQLAVDAVDLLKVDVEKGELEVLRGLRRSDWRKIRNAVIEVHDIAGRVARITSMLEGEGFKCAVDQDAALRGTNVFVVAASRD